MATLASDRVTLAKLESPTNVRMYYLLQSIVLPVPEVPTTNPPPSPWTLTEPSFVPGSNDILYTTMFTYYDATKFEYGPVNVSSSYKAAKDAWDKAQTATTSVDGKNARRVGMTQPSPPPGGWVNGDEWYRTDSDGTVVEILIHNGTQFVPYDLKLNSLMAVGSLNGTTITGATIQTSETGQRVVFNSNGLIFRNKDDEIVTSFSAIDGRATISGDGIWYNKNVPDGDQIVKMYGQTGPYAVYGETSRSTSNPDIRRWYGLYRTFISNPVGGGSGRLDHTLDWFDKEINDVTATTPQRNPRSHMGVVLDNNSAGLGISTFNASTGNIVSALSFIVKPGAATSTIETRGNLIVTSPQGVAEPKIVNDYLPVAMSAGFISYGSTINNGTGVTINGTFPSGRFNVAPVPNATVQQAARLNCAIAGTPTSSTFQVRLDNFSGATAQVPIGVYWNAIQMTLTSGAG